MSRSFYTRASLGYRGLCLAEGHRGRVWVQSQGCLRCRAHPESLLEVQRGEEMHMQSWQLGWGWESLQGAGARCNRTGAKGTAFPKWRSPSPPVTGRPRCQVSHPLGRPTPGRSPAVWSRRTLTSPDGAAGPGEQHGGRHGICDLTRLPDSSYGTGHAPPLKLWGWGLPQLLLRSTSLGGD